MLYGIDLQSQFKRMLHSLAANQVCHQLAFKEIESRATLQQKRTIYSTCAVLILCRKLSCLPDMFNLRTIAVSVPYTVYDMTVSAVYPAL